MAERLLQPLKVSFSIEVTLSGIVMDTKALQPKKAVFPIVVIPSGRTTVVNVLQLEKPPSATDVTEYVCPSKFTLAGITRSAGSSTSPFATLTSPVSFEVTV